LTLASRTALDIIDGSHEFDRRRTRILSAKAHLDLMLEHLAELVLAAAMKGATPNQLKETVLSQLAMPELRTHPKRVGGGLPR
jgi:hypothetical protein